MRRAYEAYAENDVASIDQLLTDDVTFHVPGRHPLSGEYVGKQDVFGYMARVAEVSGGEGGFDVHAITADDEHAVALVIGHIRFQDREFVRPTVHVWHVQDGRLTEFWEASIDQFAEDEFWTSVSSTS